MILLTFGEMMVFPFSNSFALDRAKRGLKEEYLALYSIAFSISHIFAHNLGFHLVDAFVFNKTWVIIAVSGLFGIGLLIYLKNQIRTSKQRLENEKHI